jgi:hypothetical protein
VGSIGPNASPANEYRTGPILPISSDGMEDGLFTFVSAAILLDSNDFQTVTGEFGDILC